MAEQAPVETGARPIATAAPPADGQAAAPPTPRMLPRGARRLRALLLPLALVIVLIGAGVGLNYYLNSLWYVSTDNAQVTGTPVPVGALFAGRVESIPVQVGNAVHKGDVLATVVLTTTANSAVVRAGVFAPFDGIVIDIPVGVGATVQPGQGVVTIVDPSTLYVSANIDETAVRRVAAGQRVDVHLDALNETVDGQVDSITPASAATFSLLPQQNTTGTYTKVTQLVPVKIDIDVDGQPLLVGTSAEIRIHVAGH